MLARLMLPTIDPTIDFDFIKAYYAWVTDRLHGRVTRLLPAPLLAAFTRLLAERYEHKHEELWARGPDRSRRG
jgi:glucosyl-3-phosphoglycerate synthase